MRERRLPLPPLETPGSGALEPPAAKCGAMSRCAFQSRSRVGAESVFWLREVSVDDMARGAEGGSVLEEGVSETRLSPDCMCIISK